VLVLRFRAGPPGVELVVAIIVATVAIAVGTTVRISGVLLAVPAIASVFGLVWRSRRKIADLALFLMATAISTQLSYLLAAAIDPDTGSYNDQAALGLGVLGGLLGVVAIVRSLVSRRRTPIS
jgi:hypothetical protein